MLLTVGSSVSELSTATVTSLGLEQSTADGVVVVDNDGNTIRSWVSLPFAIGALKTDSIHFIVVPPQTMKDAKYAGILGNDIPQNYDIEIDSTAGKVNFFLAKNIATATSSIGPQARWRWCLWQVTGAFIIRTRTSGFRSKWTDGKPLPRSSIPPRPIQV